MNLFLCVIPYDLCDWLLTTGWTPVGETISWGMKAYLKHSKEEHQRLCIHLGIMADRCWNLQHLPAWPPTTARPMWKKELLLPQTLYTILGGQHAGHQTNDRGNVCRSQSPRICRLPREQEQCFQGLFGSSRLSNRENQSDDDGDKGDETRGLI